MTKITLPQGSPLLGPKFTFGVATAAFQIEGGADKREPCIWDLFCNKPGTVADGSNGLVACDHFNRLDSDLDLIASLGVDAYRFSVSWPRVIRADGTVSQSGLDFYRRIIEGLELRGIQPYVTLYHWDLPQYLEDAGGWLNRDTCYHFRDYVDVVTKAFGDSVASYATLNEPFCSAYLGYEKGIHAPGDADLFKGRTAAHHLLLAHGLAMEVLRSNSPKASSGIVVNLSPVYPASDSESDVNAAKLADDFLFNWYVQPVLQKCYPESAWQFLPEEARPLVMDGDMDLIGQPIDYLGINYYTREVARVDSKNGFVQLPPNESVAVTDMNWEIYPNGLRDLLIGLKHRYSNLPTIVISENGAAFKDQLVNGEVEDLDRVEFIQGHLLALNDAAEQGVDIAGYFLWSLMDNFEWAFGYEKRFGITYVDYQSQKRTLKRSGKEYCKFLNSRTGQNE